MVRPGRLAQPDRLRGTCLEKEVCRHAERARAAGGLSSSGPPAGDDLVVGAENEIANGLPVSRPAIDRQIALRPCLLEEPALGLQNRRYDRRDAGVVDIDADGEVDLLRARVRLERLRETEDRVRRCGCQGAKRQGHRRFLEAGRRLVQHTIAKRDAIGPQIASAPARTGPASRDARPRCHGLVELVFRILSAEGATNVRSGGAALSPPHRVPQIAGWRIERLSRDWPARQRYLTPAPRRPPALPPGGRRLSARVWRCGSTAEPQPMNGSGGQRA